MRVILTRLQMMENLMSKLTGIFSQITVLTPEAPASTTNPEMLDQSSQDSTIVASTYDEVEENVIVAEEYVAEQMSSSELEDSQHSTILDYETTTTNEGPDEDIEDSEPELVFPLRNQSTLDSVEKAIRDNPIFKLKLKTFLKQVRGAVGTESSFTDFMERIIERKLLLNFNWYGCKGKLALNRYSLFRVVMKEIYDKFTDKEFEKEVVMAIANSHRRINNQNYRKRKKIGDSTEHRATVSITYVNE